MDAGDIAYPQRLERQLVYMEAHPEVGVCGSWVRYLGDKRRVWKPPVEDAAIRAKLLLDCPLAHPSVMILTDVLRPHSLRYSETSRYCQDYGLPAPGVTMGASLTAGGS